jgi:hypothetical protein
VVGNDNGTKIVAVVQRRWRAGGVADGSVGPEAVNVETSDGVEVGNQGHLGVGHEHEATIWDQEASIGFEPRGMPRCKFADERGERGVLSSYFEGRSELWVRKRIIEYRSIVLGSW